VVDDVAGLVQAVNELREENKDLRAQFVRVDAANQALQTWTSSKMLALWEGLHRQEGEMGKTLQALVRTVSNDSARHARIQALMEELHEEVQGNHLVDEIAPAAPRPPSPPGPTTSARPRFVEIDEPPRVTQQLVGPAAGFNPAATASSVDLDEEDETPPADEDFGAAAPPANHQPIRQSGRAPSRQGSAPPQSARVARVTAKRAMSAVPEEMAEDEGQAAKKQKIS
jgi:hypothetical protein